MPARPCKATNRHGEPCKAPPLKDDDYCSAHTRNVPEEGRFGSPEWSAKAGASPKPHAPKVMEVLIRKAEEDAERLREKLWVGLDAERPVVVGNGAHAEVVMVPDHEMVLKTVREVYDRVLGRPKQATELTGADGGPIVTEGRIDLSRLSDEELAAFRALVEKAGE